MPNKTVGGPRKRRAKAAAPDRASARAESAAVDRYIADQLKAAYDAVVAEPIPDRLLELLDRLAGGPEK